MHRIFLPVVFLTCLACCQALAYELDMSVDEQIKKKYNTSQLNYDVPNLPKVQSTSSTTAPQTNLNYTTVKPQIIRVDTSKALKIPKGTKFRVKSSQTISSSIKSGAVVSFVTTESVCKKQVMIPSGTKITATVENSHAPQILGNGGLVVLKPVSLFYNGSHYSADGRVTKANNKKIFLNNIKGKHTYWKGVAKQVNKGEAFYKKTRQISNKMSNNPIFMILSPVPTVVGAAGYGICTILSPVTAVSNKGTGVSIPAGSAFELKLTQDVYVH